MARTQDKKMSYAHLEAAYREAIRSLARFQHEGRTASDEGTAALEAMAEMAEAQEGYSRHGCAPDGNHWFRFKWTKGKHAGHYVIGGHNNLIDAALACYQQYLAVLDGKRAPLLDSGYRSRNT